MTRFDTVNKTRQYVSIRDRLDEDVEAIPSGLTGLRNRAQKGLNQKFSPTLTVAMSGGATMVTKAEPTARYTIWTRETRNAVTMFAAIPITT